MENTTTASAAAHRCARRLLKQGVPPTVAADGLIAQGLALWAAETGRHEDAAAALVAWTLIRDAA